MFSRVFILYCLCIFTGFFTNLSGSVICESFLDFDGRLQWSKIPALENISGSVEQTQLVACASGCFDWKTIQILWNQNQSLDSSYEANPIWYSYPKKYRAIKKLTDSHRIGFNDCMDQCCLQDFTASRWTWSNHSTGRTRIACRIDNRLLVNSSWINIFPNSRTSVLHPLELSFGPKPFGYLNFGHEKWARWTVYVLFILGSV